MARTLVELTDENSNWTMDEDNIYIIYNDDEEAEFTATATKISNHIASYFSQDARLYSTWNYTKENTETNQKGMKIKNIMYDVVAQCLDENELDRIQVLEIVDGPWYKLPDEPETPPEPPEEN
tara:strand:- start:237 stop:605 length:369 start_codon:yes stop_codon:yes gene_type:complete